jgi:hypothetical protein
VITDLDGFDSEPEEEPKSDVVILPAAIGHFSGNTARNSVYTIKRPETALVLYRPLPSLSDTFKAKIKSPLPDDVMDIGL